MSAHSVNQALAEILGLQKDAFRAVVVMRAGEYPRVHVTRVVIEAGEPVNKTERYRLVPDDLTRTPER
jgi:hypothetical protein